MTSTETFTALHGKARQTTEKTAQVIKQGVHQATDRADDLIAQLPKVDLSEGVQRYFEFVQQAVDLQRDLATRWAELLTSMSGSLREQAESFSHIVTEQTDKVADLTTRQAEKLEQTARDQAAKVEQAQQETVEQAQQAEKDLAREAKRVEREQAKKAHEQAQAQYTGLTKAEMADQLAERGLPRTGTVDELVERLVTADAN